LVLLKKVSHLLNDEPGIERLSPDSGSAQEHSPSLCRRFSVAFRQKDKRNLAQALLPLPLLAQAKPLKVGSFQADQGEIRRYRKGLLQCLDGAADFEDLKTRRLKDFPEGVSSFGILLQKENPR
jgi:hypothetical protein